MDPNQNPVETLYLIITTLVILAIVPHFTFRYFLEKTKNPKVNNTHQFILLSELIVFYQINLSYPTITYAVILMNIHLRDLISILAYTLPETSIRLLLSTPFIWILFFIATKFYFGLDFRKLAKLFFTTTAWCLILILGNAIIFHYAIHPIFRYCISTIICFR